MIEGAAPFRERRLFQQRGKHRGKYRGNSKLWKKKDKYSPRTVIWTRFQEFPYIETRETHELVVVLFVKQYGFGFHISLYQAQ